MAIVKLKTRDQRVNELFDMFKLPCARVRQGQSQVKPRPESVVGGSAVNNVEATRLHAVNELRRWMTMY